ncbi:unnamed protein product [Coregonus sp. 'balchen']|nr:unnamed protein product [Coregonus sp. 'balchen']
MHQVQPSVNIEPPTPTPTPTPSLSPAPPSPPPPAADPPPDIQDPEEEELLDALIELNGLVSPPMYHGPVLPCRTPTTPRPCPQLHPTQRDPGEQAGRLVRRMTLRCTVKLIWVLVISVGAKMVEQQLMARMISEMYRSPPADPAQNQSPSHSEPEDSATSDIGENRNWLHNILSLSRMITLNPFTAIVRTSPVWVHPMPVELSPTTSPVRVHPMPVELSPTTSPVRVHPMPVELSPTTSPVRVHPMPVELSPTTSPVRVHPMPVELSPTTSPVRVHPMPVELSPTTSPVRVHPMPVELSPTTSPVRVHPMPVELSPTSSDADYSTAVAWEPLVASPLQRQYVNEALAETIALMLGQREGQERPVAPAKPQDHPPPQGLSPLATPQALEQGTPQQSPREPQPPEAHTSTPAAFEEEGFYVPYLINSFSSSLQEVQDLLSLALQLPDLLPSWSGSFKRPMERRQRNQRWLAELWLIFRMEARRGQTGWTVLLWVRGCFSDSPGHGALISGGPQTGRAPAGPSRPLGAKPRTRRTGALLSQAGSSTHTAASPFSMLTAGEEHCVVEGTFHRNPLFKPGPLYPAQAGQTLDDLPLAPPLTSLTPSELNLHDEYQTLEQETV